MPSQKTIYGIVATAILASIVVLEGHSILLELLSPSHAHAQSSTIARSWEKPLNDTAVFAGYAVLVINVIGFIALEIVNYFFRPEFLGHPGMMAPDGALKTIWTLSRDIMNLLFAAMLIIMAFYTIVTGNKEKVKTHIVSFVLAVILVNFSWFFPRVIIDVAHVMTATVFSIPNLVLPGEDFGCKALDGGECKVITKVSIFPPANSVADCAKIGDPMEGYPCKCLAGKNEDAPVCWWVQRWTKNTGQYALISGLAVNYGRITGLSQVAEFHGGDNDGSREITVAELKTRFLFNLFFSLVFGIALVFPLLGLAVGLILRVIILWATIAFMPFTFLGFVINNGKLGTNVFGFERDIWKEFIVAAFLPVLIAIPITIGMVMIIAAMTAAPDMSSISSIEFNGELISGIDDFWQLIWAFFALVILWTGAFAALKKSDIIGGITERIRTTGESFGRSAAKLPLLTPIPLPGKDADGNQNSISLGALFKGGQLLEKSIDDAMLGRGSALGNAKDAMTGKATLPGEAQKAAAALNKAANTGKRRDIERHLETLHDTNASISAKEEAEKGIRDILSRDPDIGIHRDSIQKREDMLRTLEDIDKEMKKESGTGLRNVTSAKSANAKPPEIKVESSADAGKRSTHVTVNGNNVDMSDQENILRNIGIDVNTHNHREGFDAAIAALESAAGKLEDGDTKNKVKEMQDSMRKSLADGNHSLSQAWKQASASESSA